MVKVTPVRRTATAGVARRAMTPAWAKDAMDAILHVCTVKRGKCEGSVLSLVAIASTSTLGDDVFWQWLQKSEREKPQHGRTNQQTHIQAPMQRVSHHAISVAEVCRQRTDSMGRSGLTVELEYMHDN